MARQRPTLITVVAILNIVFGGLGTLCGLYSVAQAVSNAAMSRDVAQGSFGNPAAELMVRLDQRLPYHWAIETALPVVTMLLAVALILAGVGLLRTRPWARRLCLAYGVLMTLVQITYMTYQIGFVLPVTEESIFASIQQTSGGKPPPPGFLTGMRASVRGAFIGGVAVVAGFYLSYALGLLMFMLFPVVAAAFDAPPEPPAAPDAELTAEPADKAQEPARPAPPAE
jgi:hypothetical protein